MVHDFRNPLQCGRFGLQLIADYRVVDTQALIILNFFFIKLPYQPQVTVQNRFFFIFSLTTKLAFFSPAQLSSIKLPLVNSSIKFYKLKFFVSVVCSPLLVFKASNKYNLTSPKNVILDIRLHKSPE